jgi:hypothetical protein
LIANENYKEGAVALNNIIELNKGMGSDIITREDIEELRLWKE